MSVQPLSLPTRAIAFTALPPLSLYVHIPWCVRKCPYCDFNSHEMRRGAAAQGDAPALDPSLEADYVAALVRDLDEALPNIWGRPVRTLFFGGGTPSLFSAASIDALLSAIRARVTLTADAEITLEANPGTFEARKFADFRAAGVNRLSVGVQSFQPANLKALGRIHDDAQARGALEIARSNFDNFNIDLMYALPGQDLAGALADIEAALEFSPTHLSAYHLTIEPNTLFHRHPPVVPDDDIAADMQEAIEARLARAGFVHYETSAFAQPHRESRHNMNYWTFGDYLGIGAGAHSKISLPDRVLRQMRWKHPREYMEKADAGAAIQQEHQVGVEELPFEFMMNALRLTDGVELRIFGERTSLPLHAIARQLKDAEAGGLLERDHLRLRPTLKGQRFLNNLLQIFLG
jgi:putative oxygen-independent coproporphyrinogen III oxidase